MIVVDASLIVDVLLRDPTTKSLEPRLFDPQASLHAPHIIDIEVVHVFRRFAADGDISGGRGQAMIAALVDFPLRRYPHDALLPRIWDLRHSLSAYDAAYVTLAETLDAPLLTRDRRLAAAHGHGARIELV